MASTTSIDAQLIVRLNQGEARAFDQLFASKHQHVYAYCLKIIRSEALAEEVMMDVFVTIWKKQGHIALAGSLEALLFKITRDLSINQLKKLMRERTLRTEAQRQWVHPTHNPIDERVATEEYNRVAHEAINCLPPQRKLIFTMRRQLDMSITEIAQQLGISKNTVKVQLAKASRFLKEYLTTHTDISLVCFLMLTLYQT